METTDRAREQAVLQLDSIKEMTARLAHAQECEDKECRMRAPDIEELDSEEMATASREYHNKDKAREAIEEDALYIQVRSDWYAPGDEDVRATQYTILLCTGGPAVRIKGLLDENTQPETAQLEYQDWGTPWTRLDSLTREDVDALLAYAGCFYFGD